MAAILCGTTLRRILEILWLFFASILIAVITKNLIYSGYFKVILKHSPGPCATFKVNGSQDIEILPNGLAIFSSGLIWESGGTNDPEIYKREGKIYLLDLNSPNPKLEELPLINFNKTGFNPHGISIYIDPSTGGVWLFVVNHKSSVEAIEIFHFDEKGKALIHLRSVMDENIHSANDVKATGPESFYVTNSHYFQFGPSFMRILELFLFRGGNIVYYDGSRAMPVVSGLEFPSGINMDHDGRFVYVTSVMKQGIMIFRRRDKQILEFSQFIYLASMAVNIFVDENGDLLTGAHPKQLELMKHMANLDSPSPSQVISVRLGKAQSSGIAFPDYELRELYLDDGQELKASTAAVSYKQKLLIGTDFDNLLCCEVRFKRT